MARLRRTFVHPGTGVISATVHGHSAAMAWGAVILLVATLPVVLLVNAKPLARR
jgi:hypothetical protein